MTGAGPGPTGAGPTGAIAVTVLGGYLGAGKTTMLNHVLRHATERIAVLVNDFGSVNIDADLVTLPADGAGVGMITLQNGCICCSLSDGLAVALDRIREAVPRPQRAVIEASGVADPALIAAYGHQPGLRLDGTVVVVDAESLEARVRDRWVGDVVVGQIRAADLLAVTKTDLVGPDGLAAAHRRLEALAPGVPRIEVRHGDAPLEALIGLERRGSPVPEGSGLAADERFVAWHAEVDDPVDVDAVVSALRSLGPEVVRAKGVVRAASDGRRVVLQRVGRRVSAHDDGAWRGGTSRLVAIAVRATAPGPSPLDGLLPAGLASRPAAGPPPVHSG